MAYIASATLRQRSGAYSETITATLAIVPPIPMPVKTRNTSRGTNPDAAAEPTMPSPAIDIDSSTIGRRPHRSAQGAIVNEPIPIPTKPALNR